ncbi:hypothetical protein NE865_03486 [Phthorimaea operculella]|nr:hypothetical protein NE865_11744 [Phthorimaea operculella]KAI5644379.1 hypothetical protein NE865_03486 [Phthorimaea operculella]
MDLSEQLCAHGDDISKLYLQMGDFEERLKKATASPSPPAEHSDLAALSRDFNHFKSFVWQVLSKLKAQTNLLSLGLDRHETFLRRKVLLFHGIAESKEEQLRSVITDIVKQRMKISEFTSDDIQVCHRLGTSTTKPRAVLVRFHHLDTRRVVWDAKTLLKGSGTIISEFLTKSRHSVFVAARKHFGVSNCWSTEGKIAIILPDNSRRKIEVSSELQELIKRFPEPKYKKASTTNAESSGSAASTSSAGTAKPSAAQVVAKPPAKPVELRQTRNTRK